MFIIIQIYFGHFCSKDYVFADFAVNVFNYYRSLHLEYLFG